MSFINKKYVEIKSVLRKRATCETYFPAKYSFSPYRACEHSCKYCDGRSERYYIEGDFEKDIIIRKNLVDVLSLELEKNREFGLISIGSGVSDPYQGVEKDEKITRRALEAIYDKGFPCSIMTKSSLVKRDLDIIEKIDKKNGFYLMMSITSLDDKLGKIFEPNAPPFSKRIETLKIFKEKGLKIGVLAMPFLPHITDNRDNILSLFEKLKEINVDFIMPGGLTLRPGVQKETFMKTVYSYYPELTDKYLTLYGEERPSGTPLYSYAKILFDFLYKNILNLNIPVEVPHYVYKGKFANYDETFILLNHLKDIYSRRGEDISRLNKSILLYEKLLSQWREILSKNRKTNYKVVEQKFVESIKNGELSRALQNDKLARFIKEAIVENKIFDYLKRSFITP